MFVEHYPHPHHSMVDGEPDLDHVVEVFQLRPTPGDVDRLIAWSGLWGYPGASGGVAVMLPGAAQPSLVELGDFLIRDGEEWEVLPASVGIASRFTPAEL